MTDEFERRIRDAVASEGAGVRPDDGSLATIRHRVAMSKRRRLVGGTALGAAAAALVIGIAIGVGAGGGGGTTDVAVGDGGPSTTASLPCPPPTAPATETTYAATTQPPSTTIGTSDGSTTTVTTVTGLSGDRLGTGGPTTTALIDPGPSTTIPATDTTIPPSPADEIIHEAEDIAEVNCGGPTTAATDTTTTAPQTTTSIVDPLAEIVFPTNGMVAPGGTWPWPDPESTARAFLESIGVEDPALGAFQDVGSGQGQIPLHTRDGAGVVRADITRSTIYLRQVAGHWAVTAATSDSIDSRQAGVDGETLTVSGFGRDFEGTLHTQVIGHGDVDFRREAVVTASGDEELRPFTVTVDVSGSTGQNATVVIWNESGETGGPSDILAFPIELG